MSRPVAASKMRSVPSQETVASWYPSLRFHTHTHERMREGKRRKGERGRERERERVREGGI